MPFHRYNYAGSFICFFFLLEGDALGLGRLLLRQKVSGDFFFETMPDNHNRVSLRLTTSAGLSPI
jgi:hypothetical protein